MEITEYIAKLPEHWKIIEIDQPDRFFDDGRDYNKPMFIRKDGLARIYFNENETDESGYLFALCWDWHGDGDCCGDFELAIKICDDYVAKYPLIWDEDTNSYI